MPIGKRLLRLTYYGMHSDVADHAAKLMEGNLVQFMLSILVIV